MMQSEFEKGAVPDDAAAIERMFKEVRYYLQRNEPNMALHVINRGLELRPADPRFLSCLGLCKAMENKRSNEALALCEEALAAGFYDASLYCNLGKVYLIRGNRRKAYAVLKEGLRAHPRNRAIVREMRAMGIRQKVVFPFLSRGHFFNRFAGRMRKMLR